MIELEIRWLTFDSITCPSSGSNLVYRIHQNSNTGDVIFPVDEIISYVSSFMTLESGDAILTGTPEGVVLGYPEQQRTWLKPGDEVRVEIDRVGVLTNRLVSSE